MEAASARPELRLLDTATGEVRELPNVADLHARIENLTDQLDGAKDGWAAAKGEIKKLRRENAQLMGVEPAHKKIMDVLQFAMPLLVPNGRIVVAGPRWKNVRARLKDRDAETQVLLFTPLHLKAAAVGVTMSEFHMSKLAYRDPESIYADPDRVQKHIQRAVRFRRVYGTSALTLVDELGQQALAWLARRCECGRLWAEHLKDGPTADGSQPCPATGCPHFAESVDDQLERWKAEHGGEVPEAALMAAVHR